MKFFRLVLLFALSAVLSLAAVGKFAAVGGDVSVQRDGSKLVAITGHEVLQNDRITTGANGRAQIVFDDKSLVTIGKNSEFNIEEFVFDSKKQAGKAQFGMVQGAFRAVTGQIGKANPDSFTLKTRTATIGIRGTQLLAQVTANSELIACTEGGIRVLANGVSVDVPAGSATTIGGNTPPTAPQPYTQEQAQNMADNAGGGAARVENPDLFLIDGDDESGGVTLDDTVLLGGVNANANANANEANANDQDNESETVAPATDTLQAVSEQIGSDTISGVLENPVQDNCNWCINPIEDHGAMHRRHLIDLAGNVNYDYDPYVQWGFFLDDGTLPDQSGGDIRFISPAPTYIATDNITGGYIILTPTSDPSYSSATTMSTPPENITAGFGLQKYSMSATGSLSVNIEAIVTYSDGYKYHVKTSNADTIGLEINFANPTSGVSGRLIFMSFSSASAYYPDTWDLSIDGSVSKNGITGSLVNNGGTYAGANASGTINGRFFGPDAEVVGGTFHVDGTGATVDGMFLGKK